MILLGVAISIAVVVFIGFLAARRVGGDSSNFLVAGRMLPVPLVGAALMGQAVDTNATLGNTDLAAQFGFWAGACLPLGLALCLVLTGIFFAKPMNRMGLTTLPDYFRLRFGRPAEISASIMLIVAFCILVAGNLVAGGYLFNYFLGIPYWVGVIAIAVIVVAYTGAGGMIADAYTAIVQMSLILVGAIATLIWVIVAYGLTIPEGMGPFDLGQLGDPAQGATVNWATLIALGIGDIVAIDFMQRIFAARSPETARRSCFVAAGGAVAIGVPFALVALASTSILPEQVDGPVLFVLLDRFAPVALTVLVLCGIVGASMSTANGAILANAAVAVRNLGGVRRVHIAGKSDPLLRATRLMMIPMTIVAIVFAIYVKETGILLTLAFDLLLACLIVPFILGLVWRRGTDAAAMAAIVVGLAVRLVLFAMTPTIYGVDNTIFYVQNSVVDASFDGWPTFIAFGASLVAYLVVALATPAAPLRGLDIQVAADLDEAMEAVEEETESAPAAPVAAS
ncbi:sodium:solute symporter family protein [Mycolicibacterium palauense]|uniref:sodium:solute symporter family protein n=1 Tax=Mycolicibacterium palauense TaxID=2034511 RepID=UPI000BFF13E0|nr:sodium:solute symporter family protein [Mycolicibacterium palauense]